MKIKLKPFKKSNKTKINQDKKNINLKNTKSSNYLIWGKHSIDSSFKNRNRNIIKIYANSDSIDWVKNRLFDLNRQEIPVFKVDKEFLNKNSNNNPHQGIIAEVEPLKWTSLENLIKNFKDSKIRLVLLDQVTNPQNIGAILRVSKAFNAAGVIITKRNVSPENGLMARASSGAIENIPLIRVSNLARTIEFLKKSNFEIVGLEKNGTYQLDEIKDFPSIALVLGSEDKGLRRLTKEKLSYSVKIPIAVETESLNVSTAAAIALYVTCINT